MARIKTRIRKGDTVQVIAGRGSGKRSIKEGEDASDRGVRGKVLSIDRERGTALVQGVKMVYRHQRVNQNDPNAPRVGRVEKEAPIHLSNLMLVDPESDEATRVKIGVSTTEGENGRTKTKRVRLSRKSDAEIPERS